RIGAAAPEVVSWRPLLDSVFLNAKLAALRGTYCLLESHSPQDINLTPRSHRIDGALAHAIGDSKGRPEINHRFAFQLVYRLFDRWQLFFPHRRRSPVLGPFVVLPSP